MIKELSIIICVLIVFGSIHSKYVKALPFIDDDYIDSLEGRHNINGAPTADDVADFWIQSFLNNTITDQNRYEIYGDIQPKILRDSFPVRENWMIKKYCIVLKKTKNCMEVGVNPMKESSTPFEIRLRANPKVIKKANNFQMTEEDNNILKKKNILKHHKTYYKRDAIIRKRRTTGLQEKGTNNSEPYDDKESYEDDDDEYDSDDYDYNSDDYYSASGVRGVMKAYDKYNMTDQRKIEANSEQANRVVFNSALGKKKRSLSLEVHDDLHDDYEDKYFKGNNNLDADSRVKRRYDTEEYSDYKISDISSSDTKSSNTKSSDTKSSDTKSSDTKSSDTKSSDTSSSDTSSSDTKSSDTRSSDTKSSDTKSSDTKSSDTKSSSSKSSDTKSSDTKSSDFKSRDIKSGSGSASKKDDPLLDSNPSHSNSQDAFEGSDAPYLWYNCRLPDHSSNAEILCKKWTKAMACNLYCAYGYTFEEGIVRHTKCQFKEGKWSKKFEQCQPFIDCSVVLEGPGTLSCSTHHLKEGTSCDISCGKSSKEDSTSKKEYTCQKEGRWSPSLPHCATREGINVVKPPKVTEHTDIVYPDKYPKFPGESSSRS